MVTQVCYARHLRQEDKEFKANLGNLATSCLKMKNKGLESGVVVHIYNPSTQGGGARKIKGSGSSSAT